MLTLVSLVVVLASGPKDEVLLPLAPFASRDPGDAATNRHVVSLDRHGRVFVNGERRTIKEMLSWFALKGYPKPKINKDKAPRVLLRADARAPWLHVQHVVSALRISHIPQIEFGVRMKADERDPDRDALEFDTPRTTAKERADGYFVVRIRGPVSRAALDPVTSRESAPNLLTRDVLEFHAERMVSAKWGAGAAATKVQAPLNVRIQWNASRTYSFRTMATWLKADRSMRARAASFLNRRPRRVLVSATAKVPAGQVIAAMARLKAMAWSEVWFFKPTLPRKGAAVSAKALPYPPNNRLLTVIDGLEDAGIPDSSVATATNEERRR